ncbi:MAG: radical SAM/SPASM domain-containing protein [Rhodospirillales bacterium]|nr:radical SAM/SPASM domain-containing protein [Rhodospirillales bacterium]
MTAAPRKLAIEGRRNAERDRVADMVAHMDRNRAYRAAVTAADGDADGAILRQFRERFQWYREAWHAQPRQAVENGLTGAAFAATGAPPLCIDIEVAAICDLACSFCYRQSLATPDKVIDDTLCFRLIDQAVELGVPSIKFNWRGEPLLNPRLPEYVAYAKDHGVLDTMINTNATQLDADMGRRLIEAGLDLIIYSFDGGTAATYEHMRPGRFAENRFDDVYGNIREFAELRQFLGAVFPRTKIQMILTEDSFEEQWEFFNLFDDCVDDVTVKQYSERGAGLSDLDKASQVALSAALEDLALPPDTPYMRNMNGEMFVATGRLPCEQPFQRLLVTYDGRVAMCCYDWGAQHPIGYVDSAAIETGERAYADVVDKSTTGAKGFERMGRVAMPARYNKPAPEVTALRELWYGTEIDRVRSCHITDGGRELEICRGCQFKEIQQWDLVGS